MKKEIMLLLEEVVHKILSGGVVYPNRTEQDKEVIKKSFIWRVFCQKYENCPKCDYLYSEQIQGGWECLECRYQYDYGAPGPS